MEMVHAWLSKQHNSPSAFPLGPARKQWLRRLIAAVRSLGFKNGVAYWRIENRCLHQPEFALTWAKACEMEALRCEQAERWGEAKAFSHWAMQIRTGYERFTLRKFSVEAGMSPEQP